MAGNFESSLRALLRPTVIKAAAEMLREPVAGVVKAFDAAVPMVIEGVAANLADPARRGALTSFIATSGVACTVGDLASLLKPGVTPPAVAAGNHLLELVFGGRVAQVANQIGTATGVKSSSAYIMLSLAATATIGMLSQRLNHERKSAARLARLIDPQHGATSGLAFLQRRGGQGADAPGRRKAAATATVVPAGITRALALWLLMLTSTGVLAYVLYDVFLEGPQSIAITVPVSPVRTPSPTVATSAVAVARELPAAVPVPAAVPTSAPSPAPASQAVKPEQQPQVVEARRTAAVEMPADVKATEVKAPEVKLPEVRAPEVKTPVVAPPAPPAVVVPAPLPTVAASEPPRSEPSGSQATGRVAVAEPANQARIAMRAGEPPAPTSPQSRPAAPAQGQVAASVEDQLISYLEDNGPPDQAKWFDLEGFNFKTGSASLSDDSKQRLELMADILKAFPQVGLTIGGYTDSMGEQSANRTLSEARARTVVTSLVKRGIPPARLKASGYGDQRPIADNATPDGRARNRRIAVSVTAK